MRTPAGRQPSVHRCVRRFHFHRTAAVIIARINDIERDVDSRDEEAFERSTIGQVCGTGPRRRGNYARVITPRDINHVDSELSRAAKLVARDRSRCSHLRGTRHIRLPDNDRIGSSIGFPPRFHPPVFVLVSCEARRGLSQRCASFSFPSSLPFPASFRRAEGRLPGSGLKLQQRFHELTISAKTPARL